jgi:hypothetical protein
MTKIAIYGDSFACAFEGWPSYLQKIYGESQVTTFGVGGTSSNFSYMKFLETHEKYDIIIFLWSAIGRDGLITKDFESKKYQVYGFSDFIPYNQEAKKTIKESMVYNKDIKKFIKEFKPIDEKWVIYDSFYSKKYKSKNFLVNLAMRDSVKLRRPDSVNIECFSDCPEFCEYGMCEISIFDWCQIISKLGKEDTIDIDKYQEDYTKRPNHLSIQQNKEFAEYLYKHINEKNFNIYDTFANPKQYYTMSETLEESGFIL